MRSLLIAFFACAIFSCNSNSANEKNKTDNLSTGKVDTSQSIGTDTASTVYCYFTAKIESDHSTHLQADYVDFFNGPNVVEEAKERHLADTAFDKKGKITDIFVPNDYFIVNDDKTLRYLFLPRNTPIKMDPEIAGPNAKDIDNYHYFSLHYKNSLFRITVKNDVIGSISEVFLP